MSASRLSDRRRAWCGAALFLVLMPSLPSAEPPPPGFQTEGVVRNLPVFNDKVQARLTFPLAWEPGRFPDFGAWREEARAKVRASLLAPPPAAPWEARVLAEEDRGAYMARQVVFNLT